MRRIGAEGWLPQVVVRCGSLVLLAGLVSPAQVPLIFPSDTESPSQADGAKLLEAACPKHTVSGEVIECKTGCPDFTDFGQFGDRFEWKLVGVTRGHFLSPSSEDAALWMEGCEPHSENFGGTVLVTKRAGRWSMVWYKPGVETSQCHKVRLPAGREILVCIGETGAQGNITRELYVEDLLHPSAALMAGEISFFSAFDNTLTCGWTDQDEHEPYAVVHTQVDKVEFVSRDGGSVPVVAVTASFGERTPTPADVKACMANKGKVLPAMKSHRIEFVFNGHDYAPTPSNASSARIFAGDR